MMKKILLNPFFSLLEFIFQIQTERSHTGQPARRRNLQTSNPSTHGCATGVFTAPGINPSTRGVVCKIGCITYIRWSTSCPTPHISWCRKSAGSEEDVCSKIQPSLNSRIRKGRTPPRKGKGWQIRIKVLALNLYQLDHRCCPPITVKLFGGQSFTSNLPPLLMVSQLRSTKRALPCLRLRIFNTLLNLWCLRASLPHCNAKGICSSSWSSPSKVIHVHRMFLTKLHCFSPSCFCQCCLLGWAGGRGGEWIFIASDSRECGLPLARRAL